MTKPIANKKETTSVADTTTNGEEKRELTYLETVLGHDPFKKRKDEIKQGLGKGAEVKEAYVNSTLQGRFGVECGGEWEDNVRLRW